MKKFTIDSKEIKENEICIKKSRFIAKVYYVENEEQVKVILEKNKKENKEAKHIVYAYRLENVAKYSDDKEPQNTAGKPIYTLLENENLVNVLVVVIRYFGGILLGAGPLTRAYSKVAKDALALCDKKEYIKYVEENIVTSYSREKETISSLQENKCVIKEIIRTDKVNIIYLKPVK